MSAEERTIAVARHYAEVVAACRKRVAELAESPRDRALAPRSLRRLHRLRGGVDDFL